MLFSPNVFLEKLQHELETVCIERINFRTITNFYQKFCNFFQACNKPQEHQVKQLADCSVIYIECIRSYVENASMLKKEQIEVVKQFIQIVGDIPKLEGVRDGYMRWIAAPLLEKVIDSQIKLFFGKEVLKNFNRAVQGTRKDLRNAISEKSLVYLCKLADVLCTCGDYDYQIILMETIFRMCSEEQIHNYARTLFPESETLVDAICSIDKNNFDNDLRVFLNTVNSIFKNVLSIKCEYVALGNFHVMAPKDPSGERLPLWVDFNLGVETITILCDQDSLTTCSGSGSGEWETVIINNSDITQVLTSRFLVQDAPFSQGSIILCSLTPPCTVQFPSSYDAAQAKHLKLGIFTCPGLYELETEVLPRMFGEKFSKCTMSSQEEDRSVPSEQIIVQARTSGALQKTVYQPLKTRISICQKLHMGGESSSVSDAKSLKNNLQEIEKASYDVKGKKRICQSPKIRNVEELRQFAAEYALEHQKQHEPRYSVNRNIDVEMEKQNRSETSAESNLFEEMDSASHSEYERVDFDMIDSLGDRRELCKNNYAQIVEANLVSSERLDDCANENHDTSEEGNDKTHFAEGQNMAQRFIMGRTTTICSNVNKSHTDERKPKVSVSVSSKTETSIADFQLLHIGKDSSFQKVENQKCCSIQPFPSKDTNVYQANSKFDNQKISLKCSRTDIKVDVGNVEKLNEQVNLKSVELGDQTQNVFMQNNTKKKRVKEIIKVKWLVPKCTQQNQIAMDKDNALKQKKLLKSSIKEFKISKEDKKKKKLTKLQRINVAVQNNKKVRVQEDMKTSNKILQQIKSEGKEILKNIENVPPGKKTLKPQIQDIIILEDTKDSSKCIQSSEIKENKILDFDQITKTTRKSKLQLKPKKKSKCKTSVEVKIKSPAQNRQDSEDTKQQLSRQEEVSTFQIKESKGTVVMQKSEDNVLEKRKKKELVIDIEHQKLTQDHLYSAEDRQSHLDKSVEVSASNSQQNMTICQQSEQCHNEQLLQLHNDEITFENEKIWDQKLVIDVEQLKLTQNHSYPAEEITENGQSHLDKSVEVSAFNLRQKMSFSQQSERCDNEPLLHLHNDEITFENEKIRDQKLVIDVEQLKLTQDHLYPAEEITENGQSHLDKSVEVSAFNLQQKMSFSQQSERCDNEPLLQLHNDEITFENEKIRDQKLVIDVEQLKLTQDHLYPAEEITEDRQSHLDKSVEVSAFNLQQEMSFSQQSERCDNEPLLQLHNDEITFENEKDRDQDVVEHQKLNQGHLYPAEDRQSHSDKSADVSAFSSQQKISISQQSEHCDNGQLLQLHNDEVSLTNETICSEDNQVLGRSYNDRSYEAEQFQESTRVGLFDVKNINSADYDIEEKSCDNCITELDVDKWRNENHSLSKIVSEQQQKVVSLMENDFSELPSIINKNTEETIVENTTKNIGDKVDAQDILFEKTSKTYLKQNLDECTIMENKSSTTKKKIPKDKKDVQRPEHSMDKEVFNDDEVQKPSSSGSKRLKSTKLEIKLKKIERKKLNKKETKMIDENTHNLRESVQDKSAKQCRVSKQNKKAKKTTRKNTKVGILQTCSDDSKMQDVKSGAESCFAEQIKYTKTDKIKTPTIERNTLGRNEQMLESSSVCKQQEKGMIISNSENGKHIPAMIKVDSSILSQSKVRFSEKRKSLHESSNEAVSKNCEPQMQINTDTGNEPPTVAKTVKKLVSRKLYNLNSVYVPYDTKKSLMGSEIMSTENAAPDTSAALDVEPTRNDSTNQLLLAAEEQEYVLNNKSIEKPSVNYDAIKIDGNFIENVIIQQEYLHEPSKKGQQMDDTREVTAKSSALVETSAQLAAEEASLIKSTSINLTGNNTLLDVSRIDCCVESQNLKISEPKYKTKETVEKEEHLIKTLTKDLQKISQASKKQSKIQKHKRSYDAVEGSRKRQKILPIELNKPDETPFSKKPVNQLSDNVKSKSKFDLCLGAILKNIQNIDTSSSYISARKSKLSRKCHIHKYESLSPNNNKASENATNKSKRRSTVQKKNELKPPRSAKIVKKVKKLSPKKIWQFCRSSPLSDLYVDNTVLKSTEMLLTDSDTDMQLETHPQQKCARNMGDFTQIPSRTVRKNDSFNDIHEITDEYCKTQNKINNLSTAQKLKSVSSLLTETIHHEEHVRANPLLPVSPNESSLAKSPNDLILDWIESGTTSTAVEGLKCISDLVLRQHNEMYEVFLKILPPFKTNVEQDFDSVYNIANEFNMLLKAYFKKK